MPQESVDSNSLFQLIENLVLGVCRILGYFDRDSTLAYYSH